MKKDLEIDILKNLIVELKESIQLLKDEIAVLKGQKPRPKIPPSKLEGPSSAAKTDNNSGGKPGQPKGTPRCKKKQILTIHNRVEIQPENLSEGAVFKGFLSYDVQDIVFEPNNTRYHLARWMLPDGTYVVGKLPKGIRGHYGPELITYVLHQYHHNRVPEHLILSDLLSRGVLMSAGQLNNILTKGNEAFIKEVSELLSAGVKAENQLQVDDTGGRHKGKNQYTTIIGNRWFSIFNTTDSKVGLTFSRYFRMAKKSTLSTKIH